LKIFVFEFVTGGGLYRAPLAEGLVREGDMMLRTLLADLSEVDGVEVLTSRDDRLPALHFPCHCLSVTENTDVMTVFDRLMAQADAVWLIAPESGGILNTLGQRVADAGKRLLGCTPDAVRLTTLKSLTSQRLLSQGVATLPVITAQEVKEAKSGCWVVKPDDGAGCEETHLFNDAEALTDWLSAQPSASNYIIQPYQPGVPASLSMLCKDGAAWVLSCNRQWVEVTEGCFHFHGVELNGTKAHWDALEAIGHQVAQAIPGLSGYVGVDVVMDHGKPVVIEVNPRLTTAYVGLRQALGCNPARLILDLFYNAHFELPQDLARNVVNVSLHD
jgi:predicted ATP-grasp superfamily ATP-dependent carboligase